MTKPLPPAAQAVLDALHEGWQEWTPAQCLAAALRAVADQVVPKCAEPFYGDDFSHGAWFGRDDVRDDLLRMADELKTQ